MTIEILESSVQGHSLVAGRHFKPGDLVMQEPVLFSVATDRLGGVIKSRADAMLSMQQLSSEVFQEAFESARWSQEQLQSYSIIQGSSNLNRFQIASYDMCAEWSQKPEAFGYGEKGVYLNHSCEPNLIYYWNPQEEQMQLRALAEISPSDELTVNYLAPEIWMDKAERQGDRTHLLKLDQCECRKCTGVPSDVSDARIKYINEMEQTLMTVASGGDTLEDVSKVTENFVQQCELELGGKATSESTFPVYLDPRLINVSVSCL
ncbi:SET domain-containing protein [Aspergillus puulaauensis]|uniref:SET domain-containing protein n=1 Tax=Aspergillus puulaauensis TaxID=1220207 RepID=A0A7R7XUK2_9EURO|nr:uncharacterized protein APUU_60802A [Aspergillus puulaauensis]BCS27754.1 hypothetical protein APUU_60802A [Aspergillus puulaauensis]